MQCLLLLISMLWHRQAIFKSNGDKLSSSAECRISTRGLRHQIASRLNAHWQTDWAIEDQAKNLNSTARPYDQRAFSPLDSTASWPLHLALAIYMFIVVNFDALYALYVILCHYFIRECNDRSGCLSKHCRWISNCLGYQISYEFDFHKIWPYDLMMVQWAEITT